MSRAAWISAVALLAIGPAPLAMAQGSAPAAVTAKTAQLDQACLRAGGRPAGKPYVLVHDFTGDGRPDFLVSEGDYGCAGRPGIFQSNNQAFIEIYVADPRIGAQRVYRQQVRAYRVLNTTPRTVQIALAAPACAGGQAMCGLTLTFNPQTGGFNATPGGQGQAAAQPPAPSSAVTTPAPQPEAQGDFIARCQRELIAADPKARQWAAETCKYSWDQLAAAGPAADTVIALATARTATPLNLAQIKAATPAVRWQAQPGPAGTSVGALGRFAAVIDMKAGTASFNWSANGQPVPFDLPAALKSRGVGLSQIACWNLGLSEVTRVYRLTVSGRPPTALTVYSREAPTASASSSYNAVLEMTRPPPTLAALRAKSPDDDWQLVCDGK